MNLGKFSKTIGFKYNMINQKPSNSSDGHNLPFQLPKMKNDSSYFDSNQIRFWDEVDDESCKNLIENIKEVEFRLDELSKSYSIPFENLPSIELYINSPGGSVHDALAVVDHIQCSKFKFTSIIEGCAASAATIISTVCDERKIYGNAMVLIHELSSGCYGKMFEINDGVNSLKKVMDIIIKIYRENTNVSIDSLKQILKHDIYWTAEEALRFGIVDSVIQSVKVPRYVRNTKRYKISDKDLESCVISLRDKDRSREKKNSIDLLDLLSSSTPEENDEDEVDLQQVSCKNKSKANQKRKRSN